MRYLRRVADLSEIGWVNGTLIGYTHLSMKDSDTFSMSTVGPDHLFYVRETRG